MEPSRQAAYALALGLLGDRAAVTELDRVARTTGCPALRGISSLALGMLRAETGLPSITQALLRTPDTRP